MYANASVSCVLFYLHFVLFLFVIQSRFALSRATGTSSFKWKDLSPAFFDLLTYTPVMRVFYFFLFVLMAQLLFSCRLFSLFSGARVFVLSCLFIIEDAAHDESEVRPRSSARQTILVVFLLPLKWEGEKAGVKKGIPCQREHDMGSFPCFTLKWMSLSLSTTAIVLLAAFFFFFYLYAFIFEEEATPHG